MRIPTAALFGLFFTGLYFFVAIFAGFIAPYGLGEIVGDVWEPARLGYFLGLTPDGYDEPQYWLGTDQIGRDLLTRMIYGGQTTIWIATMATILSFTTGTIMGFVAAVNGGWIDQALSRFIDLVMSIPSLIVALVVLSVLDTTILTLILVMGLLDSTRVFRLARAVAVDITVMDYVEAARLRGERVGWIIFREILPNALSPLVAEMGLRFIFMVLFISTLSFLGIGVQPPAADWGGIVKDNKDGINFGIGAALYPAVAIATLAISVNLVADWILNRTTSLKGGRG
ncbi:ABC transporter permease subunit [Pseudosulfitobacter sp. SM2401]|uniref:ABC transporter permease n=1 Tax=Pseudosulfitobacter sp. SM2401 TaxID=3350098 RepID=UPI002A266025|nr:ABC transporter permease [Ascidiaceihabitans sp.]